MVRRTTATSTTTTTTTTATLTNTIIPPKKKKGRPSLLDLQQRKLLQQQQQQQQQQKHQQHKNKLKNPNSQSQSHFPNHNHNQFHQSNPNNSTLFRRPRSTRRIPNLPAHFIDGSDSDDDDHNHHSTHNQHSDNSQNSQNSDDEEIDDVDDDDDDDERAQKKVKLVVQFPNSNSNSNIKKFRNAVIKDEKGSKATDNENGTRRMQGALEHGPTASTSTATTTVASTTTTSTALPDKKLLLLILDRLQKKDTRGVFAEPVDPEELPDYHDIIENPMDFDTVRKKLMGGLYSNLEQLEDDINLICSNAMQYNAPSTVFFRQARAIQELTKKEFETLKQDGALTELPAKPRRGRPPGSRNLKKLLEKSSPPDRSVRESSSDATPASREEDTTKSGNYNLRKGPSLYRFPRNFDNCFDLSASSSKSMSAKYGKKPCGSDDSRRETYYLGDFDSGKDSQLLATFGGPERQLTPVALGSDHSYARSLAKFAADLGPDVWRIASKKISRVLPSGVEFGPGWVGENDTRLVRSNSVSRDPSMSEAHHMSTSGLINSSFISKPPTSSEKSTEYRESNSNIHQGGNGVVGPNPSWHIQHQGSVYPRMNGFNGNFVSASQYQEAMARPTPSSLFNPQALDPSSFDASKSFPGVLNSENDMVTQGMPYWQNLSMQERWDRPYPVELNGGFQASGSRSLPIGSPPQVDLVLQL